MRERAPQVVCMGEILIDFAAQPKGVGLNKAKSFAPAPGGAPANVAVGLSQLGVPSAFVGKVGQDAFGDLLKDTLDNKGVDTRGLTRTVEQPTTLAFVAIDSKGVPSFVFNRHPGADLLIAPEDIDWALFDSAKVLHFGSLSMVAKPAYDATFACIEYAHANGLTLSYDPNDRPALWPDRDTARATMLEPLKYVTFLKVSKEELAFLSEENTIAAGCDAIAQRGPKVILVTEGRDGMTGWLDGETFHVAGHKVNEVDTTGCGDASVAACLASLLASGALDRHTPTPEQLKAAIAFANRCAAFTATRPGAIPALPTRTDVASASD